MPSLKSVVFGMSSFHDGSVSAFESCGCECGCDGIDFPKLETIAFGNSTFIQSENAVFRGGLVSVG